MSATDDLKAAGFSDDEVNSFATEKRQSLLAGGFSEDEVNDYLGHQPPNTLSANKAFARAANDSIRLTSGSVSQDLKEGAAAAVEDFRAPFEAAANTGTGLLTGFPAYIGSALLGLAQKHLLGMDVDPKEMAETSQAIATYQPKGPEGLRLAGQLAYPLQLVNEAGEAGGHKVTDVTGSPVAGAITEATIQMLPGILLGEFGRKMGGQTVTADDMKNVAKVVAGPDAPAAAIAATESSLHQTYEKTGIGPFTVADQAKVDPTLRAELADPAVGVPSAFEPYLEKPPEPVVPVPGDGMPLLEMSGDTGEEAKVAKAAEEEGNAPEPAPATPLDIVEVRKRQSVMDSIMECLQ